MRILGYYVFQHASTASLSWHSWDLCVEPDWHNIVFCRPAFSHDRLVLSMAVTQRVVSPRLVTGPASPLQRQVRGVTLWSAAAGAYTESVITVAVLCDPVYNRIVWRETTGQGGQACD